MRDNSVGISKHKNIIITQKLSNKISWLQFFCALVVITDHSFDYINYADVTKPIIEESIYFVLLTCSQGLTYIAMPIFFVISAVLLFKDFDEKNIWNWYKNKLYSRFFSLVMPYLIWNTIWTILFLAVSHISISNNIDGELCFENIIGGIVYGKYNEVFWFMKVLILYTIFSPVIACIIKQGRWLTIIVAFMLLSFSNALSEEVHLLCVFYNLLFYILGAYISLYRNIDCMVFPSKTTRNIGTYFCFAFLVALCLEAIIRFNVFVVADFKNAIMIVLITSAMWLFWRAIDIVEAIPAKWYTKCAFLIYAMHKPIQQSYNKLIASYFSADLYTYCLNLVGGLVFTSISILSIVYVLHSITPRFLFFLNGKRKIYFS